MCQRIADRCLRESQTRSSSSVPATSLGPAPEGAPVARRQDRPEPLSRSAARPSAAGHTTFRDRILLVKRIFGAAYPADRAAGLAGVPLTTLYYWTRTGLWTPSVSATKEMRWSYSDVLALRLIDWLRHEKGEEFSATSMHRIRRALAQMEELGERLESRRCRVWVDRRGGIMIGEERAGFVPLPPGMAQRALDLGEVDLLAAFTSPVGCEGPDLRRPRPTLRIVPGKLAGEPHIEDTRVPTTSVAALIRRGFATAQVLELYADVREQSVLEAVDLEDQIRRNSESVAA